LIASLGFSREGTKLLHIFEEFGSMNAKVVEGMEDNATLTFSIVLTVKKKSPYSN
jgi:hypothetical protein